MFERKNRKKENLSYLELLLCSFHLFTYSFTNIVTVNFYMVSE